MEKILVVRYGTIGDTIFASAFYRELKNAKQNAQIDALVDDIAFEVMQHCPYVNNFYKTDGKYRNLIYYINIFRKYDTVYFLKNDSFFTILAVLCGVKKRIGFNIRRNKFLTVKSPYNGQKHEAEYYLDLLRLSKIPIKSTKTELWLNKINDMAAKEITKYINRPKILIHAYSRFEQKNWSDNHWKKVIKYISDELEAQIFFVGGKKDFRQYNTLTDNTFEYYKYTPINMSGKLTIQETFSLVKQMDLVIGVDSGIIHAAAALNIPSILLHGPTSLVRWKPLSENCKILSRHFCCSPCCLEPNSKKYCKNRASDCMTSLNPKAVITAIRERFNYELKQTHFGNFFTNSDRIKSRANSEVIRYTP